MRHALSVVAVLAVGWAGNARAADWTDAVFPERSHEFGTVARGSKVRHSFKLINTTNQEIHIASWTPQCGCTDVRIGARDIPPGTQTVVEATIDTTRFTGYKPSGLTLVLDRPSPATVDLKLSCFIRADVTLNPGQVDFGVANRSAQPKVELNLTYAGGQAKWAIVEMKTISDHFVATITEMSRSPGGQVSYQLSAVLRPTAPVGIFKDQITLKTNDPTSPYFPISVSGVIQSNITVSPTVINLGRVRPGETVQRTVLVRSAQPFRVEAIKSARPELSVPAPTEESRAMHSIILTLKAPTQVGPFNSVVEIETDVKDEAPARVTAFATVAP